MAILFTLVGLLLTGHIVGASEQVAGDYFAFINGGYSETTNLQVSEDDLRAFAGHFTSVGLSRNQTTILNAGGADTRVVATASDGSYLRDVSGMVIFRPTSVRSPNGSATLDQVDQYFSGLAKKRPAKVTLVYGDHGSPNGVKLWDLATLSNKDLRAYYAALPSKTVVRSVHLHCYGGAALADSERALPLSQDGLGKFLSQHYQENRCGLAVAPADVLSTSLSSKSPSEWRKMLSKDPTLRGLQKRLLSEQSVESAPVLTSDYFAEDITNTLCRVHSAPRNKGVLKDCEPPTDSLKFNSSGVLDRLKSSVCGSSTTSRLATAMASYRNAVKAWMDSLKLKDQKLDEYLSDHYPNEYLKNSSGYREIERLKARYAAGKKDASSTRALWSRVRMIKEGDLSNYERLRLSVKISPKFLAYLNLGDAEQRSSDAVAERVKELRNSLYTAQKERKELAAAWLELPENKTSRKLYENIQKCESSTLH